METTETDLIYKRVWMIIWKKKETQKSQKSCTENDEQKVKAIACTVPDVRLRSNGGLAIT